jgi:raffinose/stachyose/melibiose transport system permease protein
MAARKIPWNKVKYHKEIYLFILPTAVMVGLFAYYPASNGLIHSFYRWNGADIEEFLGFRNYLDLFREDQFWTSFKVAFLLGFVNVVKMIPALAVAVLIHRVRSDRMQYLYRVLFVVPMVIPGVVIILLWKFFFEPTVGILNTVLRTSGILDVLAHIDGWFGWEVFTHQDVAWLGEPLLAFPALIIWGFPWVGTFAVLTYLARLQGIGEEIYESAEIDGANAWNKFRHVELPLILSMVRINLVFVILGTLQDVALIMLLFTDLGGPGGVVQVPALFMYREAFSMMHFGKACAIGVVLTLIVFALSKVNEKIIRVEH